MIPPNDLSKHGETDFVFTSHDTAPSTACLTTEHPIVTVSEDNEDSSLNLLNIGESDISTRSTFPGDVLVAGQVDGVLQAQDTAEIQPLRHKEPPINEAETPQASHFQEIKGTTSNSTTETETHAVQDDDESKIDWRARIHNLPLLPSVKEFDFEGFKNRWGENDRYHIIELLMGSDSLLEQVSREKEQREEARRADRTGKKRRRQPPKTQNLAGDTWIQRIRIHSPILLRHLKDAMRAPDWDFEQPRVFFRPFKALIYYHPHMKKVLEVLEKELTNNQPAVGENKAINRSTSVIDNKAVNKESGGLEGDGRPETNNSTKFDDTDRMHNVTAVEHLRCYIEFMESRILPMENMFNGTDNRMVRFDELWYLFKIDDILYAPAGVSAKPGGKGRKVGRYQTCFRLYFKGIPEIAEREPDDLVTDNSTITLWCYHLDHDGESYGPVKESFDIEAYPGHKDIGDLLAFPIRFASNAEKLQEDWARQGKRFRELITQKHVSCEGWTLTGQPLGTMEKSEIEVPEHVESDAIIDFGEALKRNPSWKPEFEAPSLNSSSDYWSNGIDVIRLQHWPDPSQKNEDNEPWFSILESTQRDDDTEQRLKSDSSEADLFLHAYRNGVVRSLDGLDEDINNLLLPRRFFVYILRQRRFAMVDIFSLSLIPPQSTIFDELRIDEGHKLIVQSLVEDHFKKRRIQRQRPGFTTSNQDIVRGKGSGLFILLHGVPGVGKTATAEAVAQANNKPLFTITCGDLGLTPEAVDSKLNEVFRLAHLWDCVLLLDEADIFLARRDTFNLTRNALVSVFLRVLEYYSGILFLTTNRVGILDEAFKSRIHIGLYYEPLSREQTVEIFRVNIEKLRQMEKEKERNLQGSGLEQPKLRILAKSIVNYARSYYDDQEDTPHLRWNGRQIRNAFQIASSLAHYDMRASRLSGGNLASSQDSSPVLNETHFEKVAETIEKFGNYLDYAKAMTYSDEARLEAIRADDIHNSDLTPQRRGYSDSWPARSQTPVRNRRSETTPSSRPRPQAYGQPSPRSPAEGDPRIMGVGKAGDHTTSLRSRGQRASDMVKMTETPARNRDPRSEYATARGQGEPFRQGHDVDDYDDSAEEAEYRHQANEAGRVDEDYDD